MKNHKNSGIEKRFIISIILTAVILATEVVGGIWTGSLALLSDAAHVFMDVFALALSYLALRLSSLPPDDRHTYGYHRLEVLAALVNGFSLLVISMGIFWEAYQRWQAPVSIRSLELLIIATIGLAANLYVAFILRGRSHGGDETHDHGKEDINLHSAYLHVVGDAISSFGVILAAVIILLTSWGWVDALVSAFIGGLILFSSVRVIRSSLHILIEGVPVGISIQEVAKVINQVEEVREVHDLHVWSICSGNIALSAHLVLSELGFQERRDVMAQVKLQLVKKFGIEHSTIQFDEDDCFQNGKNCYGIKITA